MPARARSKSSRASQYWGASNQPVVRHLRSDRRCARPTRFLYAFPPSQAERVATVARGQVLRLSERGLIYMSGSSARATAGAKRSAAGLAPLRASAARMIAAPVYDVRSAAGNGTTCG